MVPFISKNCSGVFPKPEVLPDGKTNQDLGFICVHNEKEAKPWP
jgi:hypothetical protein